MSTVKFWALIPAAGCGKRMNADMPKQYLTLAGKSVLQHSLALFMHHPRIAGVAVVLEAQDTRWTSLAEANSPRVHVVTGGTERAHSVLAGLHKLQALAHADDWVLVHDAARPCLTRSMLDSLIQALEDDPVGGLLALPVHDTVKQAQGGRVAATLDRSQLWLAQTPQMFRLGPLSAAMNEALRLNRQVTDEAAAMEMAGQAPKLVPGSADNLKITRHEDLERAEFILRCRQEEKDR